ncbi:MAG: caspase family protein [Bacteroidales bacterium]
MRKLLAIVSILSLTIQQGFSQKIVVSEWSKIDLMGYSFLPEEQDTIPPLLQLKFPQIKPGNTYDTYDHKMTVIGYVEDSSLIKNIIFNSKQIYHNSSGVFTSDISLERGLNKFKIIALDEHLNYSEMTFMVNRLQEEKNEEVLDVKGTYYGLFMCVNNYEDVRIGNLQNPISDALALKEVLVSRYTFSNRNIVFLENPTSLDIRLAFDSLSRVLTEEDNLFIFYAGHGYMDEEANTGFWLPSDARLDNRALWLRNSYIIDLLKEIRSKHTLLVTDACFAGSIFASRAIYDYSTDAIFKLYSKPSRKAMTSGNKEEVPDQSAFIKYYIERLVKNENQYFSADQLFSSFRQAVIHNSDVLPQYAPIKNVGDEGGEFIFILK